MSFNVKVSLVSVDDQSSQVDKRIHTCPDIEAPLLYGDPCMALPAATLELPRTSPPRSWMLCVVLRYSASRHFTGHQPALITSIPSLAVPGASAPNWTNGRLVG